MEVSIRPYVTAGVVIASAGLVAAAPIGPSALEIQTRTEQIISIDSLAADAGSALSVAQDFPVSTWSDVFSNASSNLESLQSQFGSDGNPILQAILDNQVIYSNDLTTAAENAGSSLTNALQDFPNVLSNAMSDLTSGDVFDAETSISQFLTQTSLSVLHALNNGVFQVEESMASNWANLLAPPDITRVAAISDALVQNSVPVWYSELVSAQLMAPHAAELAFSGVSQDIVTALQDGNSALAFSDLMNGPSTILDAFLNGYNLGDGGGFPAQMVDAVPAALRIASAEGLLSARGAVATIHEAIRTIAQDISPRRAEQAVADLVGAAGANADVHSVVGDLSTLMNPDSALGEFVTAFDPNAIADITSLLTGDLAPNASGWVVDLFGLF